MIRTKILILPADTIYYTACCKCLKKTHLVNYANEMNNNNKGHLFPACSGSFVYNPLFLDKYRICA